MPAAEYHAAPGLSNSAMKDLAVSALRFWHCHVNPKREARKETEPMALGTALHTAVLEPDAFDDRYAVKLDRDKYRRALDTTDELKDWLRAHDAKVSGTKKELIDRIRSIDPKVQILADIFAKHHADNEGKYMLELDDAARIKGAAKALQNLPDIQTILAKGTAEVSVFAEDPATGVLLKARMDWWAPDMILDLKTFTQQRGKSIGRSVADALFYERYYIQAYFYSRLRGLVEKEDLPVVMAFVESDAPHETRLRKLQSHTGTPINVYWSDAEIEVDRLIGQYARYSQKFAGEPWLDPQPVHLLHDEDIPQMAWPRPEMEAA